MKTAIFLGAGASRAEGVPTQDELFSSYFDTVLNGKDNIQSDNEMKEILIDFFHKTFNIDINSSNYKYVNYPAFEEVLGILDLAEMKRDMFYGLKNYNNFSQGLKDLVADYNKNKIIQLYLILLITRVLNNSIPRTKGLHKKLIRKILDYNLSYRAAFITTNYDTIIDNAILSEMPNSTPNYGIDFTNYDLKNGWPKPDEDSIELYKMHGSLNWLHCPNCNNIALTKREKEYIHLITDFSKALCPICNSVMFPIIVPPTYFKDLSSIFISTVWNKVENLLRDVSHIIFCGYSFCDADIHVKYLVKRLQIYRNYKLRITVFNNYEGKSKQSLLKEENRYKRFLGSEVDFTSFTFDDFVDRIENYL